MSNEEKCKYCTEFIVRIEKFKKEIESLRSDNVKMKITLEDNGLMEDVKAVSDLEAICVEQLEKWKDRSANETFDKDDAKVIETIGNCLLRVRGGKIGNDSSKAAKKLKSEDLLDIIKKNEDNKGH